MKVFKIPDGNGNIRYRVQTPDGVWHDTDEDGNYLPPVSREMNGVIREHKSRRSPKSEGRINLGVAFSQEESETEIEKIEENFSSFNGGSV